MFHFILGDVSRAGYGSSAWFLHQRKRYLNHFYKELMISTAPLSLADAAELAQAAHFYTTDVGVGDVQTLLTVTADPGQLDPARRWLAHCLRGMIYVEHAWNVRGNGWGNTVEQEQWRQFRVFLQLAADELQAAWRQEPRLAEPAAVMITVTMGQNNGRERRWFDVARRADPYHTAAYRNLRWASRTRWGGDAADLWDVSRLALAGDLYATGVPDQFFDGLGDLEDDHGQAWLRQGEADAWPAIDRYLEQRAASPTPDRPADWCWSQRVYLGDDLGQAEAAWAAFEQLDHDPDRLHQPHLQQMDRRWSIGMLRAKTDPPTRDAVQRLQHQLDTGRYDQVIAEADAALTRRPDPWTAGLYHDLRRQAIWARDYRAGQEIDLLEYGLEGWRPARGRWIEATDRGLLAEPKVGEGIRLINELNLGNRYTVELEMTLPQGFHRNHYGGIGLVLDPVIGRPSSRHTLITYARRNEYSIYLQDPGHDGEDDLRMGDPHAEHDVTLRLERWDQSLRIWINGQRHVDRYDLQGQWDREGRLALGGWHRDEELVYHFQALRVQRLERSPFVEAPPDAL